MSLGLSAPAALPVEMRTADRRVYRLTWEIGLGGMVLIKPAPFEPGRPVTIRFSLPGDPVVHELEAELTTTGDPAEQDGDGGACGLTFLAPPLETRGAISSYIADRLGLPPLPPGLT